MAEPTLAVDKRKPNTDKLINPSRRSKRIVPYRYQMFGFGLNALSYFRNEWAANILSDLWFTVFKSKPKPWTIKFWQQADSCVDVKLKEISIPVYLWGEGPLVVLMHGWSGSGTQFRKIIPGLVKAGYQVACFDAPAHGYNAGKQSHLLEFCETLIAIQQQIGKVHTIMAHSFGAMAVLTATQRGFSPQQMVLFGPHLDAHEMFKTYSGLLNLNPKLSTRFRDIIGGKMNNILTVDDVWKVLTPASLLNKNDCKGLLIFDQDDEEIPQLQFKAVETHWKNGSTIKTRGLGHHRILKDKKVIQRVVEFMGS